MRPDEVRAAGAVVGTVFGEVAAVVRDTHSAVAGRVFRLLGPLGAPTRVMHDGISALAYSAAALGVRTVPHATGAVVGVFGDPSAESAHDRPGGGAVLSAVSGILGDRLADERPALATPMRIRTHDGRLRHHPAEVARDAAASATDRIAVFLHGLCETDRVWHLGARRCFGNRHSTYGSRLHSDHGWTPLYVSYNTGRHISENGRELADLLEALVAAWPHPLREVTLVGHSMGGLLARSAVHHAADASHEWVDGVRHVIGLGAPHLGAPLERFANWGSHRLGRLPETRPLARILNQRSVGIKDLRYGAVVEADWAGWDADELLCDRCTPARLHPGVAYYAVAATLTRSPDGPFPVVGDLLVEHSSATGNGPARRIPFEPDRMLHVGRRHHFNLLAEPLVYEQLRTWLGRE